jgi:dihydromonapterin reductase/dihydrofolate reductase
MGNSKTRPILITGGGRRIGLALAHHFLSQQQPIIVSYRTLYPAIEQLTAAGALCIQADFSSDEGVLAFADIVKEKTEGLRAIIHNAGDWAGEKPGVALPDVLSRMLQIHVHAPTYLTMRWKDYCADSGMPLAILFTLPIMLLSAEATNISPMPPVKPRWII